MTKGRLLVTGAGGFVGSALAEGFADLGYAVVALDRAFDAAPPPEGVRRLVADLDHGVPDEVGPVDVVVHAAWVTTSPAALGVTDPEYHVLNLKPLAAILRYVADTEPWAFVFLSSSGVFAAGDAPAGLTDVAEPTGDSPYAVAKRRGEALVVASLGSTAMHVVRLGYLYGPGEVARPSRLQVSPVARWVAAARDGRPLEVRSDAPRREWTYAPDLAAALERVVARPAAAGPIHLCCPQVWDDRTLAGVVSAAVPESVVETVPAEGRVKPPMVPTDLPALRDFEWTPVHEGVRAILDREAAA